MGFKIFIGVLLSLCVMLCAPCAAVFADELDAMEEFPATAEEILEAEENSGDVSETENNEESPENAENNDGGGETVIAPSDELDAAAGHSNEDQKKVTVHARNIRIKSRQQVTLVIGKTHQIQYKLSPSNSDDIVTFRSMNKSVIRVDADGLVTAVGYGTAKVKVSTSNNRIQNVYFTVTDESGDSEPDITYEEEEVTEIELIDKMAMIRVGKTMQIEYLLYPLGIQDTLTYASKNTSVAKVSSKGVVTGVGAGSTTITVTAGNGVSAELSVTVYDDALRGIDVSKWQGDIDWKKVSLSGIDFAMIRSSYGNMHTDEKLAANVAGCEKYGIPYGFYHYSYADSVKEARKEARYFLSVIKNYNPEYPLVLDIENDHFKSMSRKQVTNIIIAFVQEIEKAGYYASVYSFAKFFNDYVDMSKIEKYDIWIACWGDEERLNSFYDGPYGMWQYSATGKVNGIDGEVDLDYAYKDYRERIRQLGLNNL
ncbi:MAG: Ig-like domain-containing protein [Ruminococcus sp.]|nr:Ig-like domain-containing protein [Ruminococcus sp.]